MVELFTSRMSVDRALLVLFVKLYVSMDVKCQYRHSANQRRICMYTMQIGPTNSIRITHHHNIMPRGIPPRFVKYACLDLNV